MDASKLNFLQTVLKYSTANSVAEIPKQHEDIQKPAEFHQMDPERKQWLEEALCNMSINPTEEMNKCLTCLKEEQSLDRHIESLQTLRDWCEDINCAVDFHKINGYDMIPTLLNHENHEIRALTCDLIGACAQNNEYCQETFISAKILPLILKTLKEDKENDVKIKALFAISCISRDYLPAQKKLIEENGLDIIIQSLKSPLEKLQIKSCFFCSSICTNPEIKSILTSKKLLETLVEMYSQQDSNIHEHILSAINMLIEENPSAINQAKNMKNIDMKQILKNRLEIIRDDPRYLEEKDMATKIFEGLFQN